MTGALVVVAFAALITTAAFGAWVLTARLARGDTR